jgi:heptosyltransferase-2
VNLLVRLPNWLGDVVMATPALRALRRSFPDARIAWLAKPPVLSLLRGLPWCDEEIPWGAGGAVQIGLALRARRFDRAILFPSSWSSAIAARVAGIPERLGYAEAGRGLLLTRTTRAPVFGRLRPLPKVDFYWRLAALAGCRLDGESLLTELPDLPAARERAEAWLAAHGVGASERPIALSVGASFGPSKEWIVERWAEVADHFLARGERVIVYGGPADRPTVQRVIAACRAPGAIEATDVKLDDLVQHLRRARLVISTDAGGRHIAVAAGTPTVVIMGSTHPGYSEGYSPRYTVLLDRPPCWPCHLRVCPIDHRCMTAIAADRVIDTAERWLRGEVPFGGQRPWLTPPGAEHRLFRGAAC